MAELVSLFVAGIAKGLIKTYVKSDGVQEALKELVPWGTDRLGKSHPDDAKRVDQVTDQVVRDLKPLFDMAKADAGKGAVNVEAVAYAAARVVLKGGAPPDLMLRKDLNSAGIAKAFRDAAKSQPGLSEAETNLLDKVLDALAPGLLDIADLLDGWHRAFPREALERLTIALAELAALRADRTAEIFEFEDGYRNAIRVQHDRLDFIGPRDIDSHHRRQSLEVSYISLDVEAYNRPTEYRRGTKPGTALAASSDPAPTPFQGEGWGEVSSSGTSDLAVEADDFGIQAPFSQRGTSESGEGMGMRAPEGIGLGSASSTIASGEQILRQTRRLVIRGDAGAGKTTLLQWVAVQAATPDSPHRPNSWRDVTPFVIKLRSLKGRGMPALEEFVPLSAENAPRPTQNWVFRQFNSGRAIVLIDGVDELPESDRNGMLEVLENLVKQFPLSRYVISSRPPALSDWPEWEMFVSAQQFTEVTLRAMGKEQIGRFIDHWHRAAAECFAYRNEPSKWTTLPVSLKALLARGDQLSLRKLASTPLLCAMICALHVDYGDNMPTSKIDLYDECVGMLLTDREEKRAIPSTHDYPKPGKSDRRELAQTLAYHMMDIDVLDMPIEDVDSFYDAKLAHRTTVDWTGLGIRRLFTDRCSLLREPVVGRLDFRHKTFQEFLAAEHARNAHIVLKLAQKSQFDGWRETIVMASALFNLSDCEKLLLKMVDYAKKNPRPFATALACLASDKVSKDVRERVVEASSWLFPPTLDTAANVAAAGDQAVPFLHAPPGAMPVALDGHVVNPAPPTNLASATPGVLNPTLTPDQRAACVRALSYIGTPLALHAIQSHARADAFLNSSPNDDQWRTFVRELLGARDSFSASEYFSGPLLPFCWTSLPAFSNTELFGDTSVPALINYLIGKPSGSDSYPAPSPFQGEGWGEVSYSDSFSTPASFSQRGTSVSGEGVGMRAPGSYPTTAQWWGLALAAYLFEENKLAAADLPAGNRNHFRDCLILLLNTPYALPPPERALCGRVLSLLGDPRPGVGLTPEGLPDIVWCDVPAGEFIFGSDTGNEDGKPSRLIDLEAFRIAKYPVTLRQYQAFLDAEDGYTNPWWWDDLSEDGIEQQRGDPGEQTFMFGNSPRENVSWYDATVFCNWLSAKSGYEITLPTEEQWEKAARGVDGRIYPHGNEFEATKGNTIESGIGQTSCAGTFPSGATPYGVLDMRGNVAEWTTTKFDSESDTIVGSNTYRVLRGGSWGFGPDYGVNDPKIRNAHMGFRLVCPANNP